ncbi:MAG: YraN family protein [Mycobacteriales bacterium]
MQAKDAVGQYGERVAARRLEEDGLRVLDRNWRCDEGELDIVALHGEVLAFIEVKTRTSEDFGVPAEAVTPVKQQRIRGLAQRWLAAHEHPYSQLRFDVCTVVAQKSGSADYQHLQGAF